jgi:hypothetical protein
MLTMTILFLLMLLGCGVRLFLVPLATSNGGYYCNSMWLLLLLQVLMLLPSFLSMARCIIDVSPQGSATEADAAVAYAVAAAVAT